MAPDHAWWVRPDRRVVCWGLTEDGWKNSEGQLDGTPAEAQAARLVPGVRAAEEVRVTARCSCARTTDGRVICWGQCPGRPPAVTTPTERRAVSWGECALGMRCELGNESEVSCVLDAPGVTARVGGATSGIEELIVGGWMACWREESGSVRCWKPDDEESDDGVCFYVSSRPVEGLAGAVELAEAEASVCARTAAGSVVCVTATAAAQSLDPGRPWPTVPVDVSDAVSLAAGGSFCALRQDGSVVCWPAPGLHAEPTQLAVRTVEGVSGAKAIAVDETGCALGADGALWCWPADDDSMQAAGSIPVRGIQGATDGIRLAVSSRTVCVLDAAGSVFCAGRRDERLGSIPGVAGLAELAAVAGGFCGRTADERLICWPGDLPVDVEDVVVTPLPAGTTGLVARGEEVCVRATAGSTHLCWSDFLDLKPGPAPEDVDGISSAASFVLSERCGCAWDGDGALRCWGAPPWDTAAAAVPSWTDQPVLASGWNDGIVAVTAAGNLMGIACGERSPWTASSPVGGVRDLAAGSGSALCLLRDGGSVHCGAAPLSAGPPGPLHAVPEVSDATAVSVGSDRGCARMSDGGVACWIGSMSESTRPVATAKEEGLADVRALAGGGSWMCAQEGTARVLCWIPGDDAAGTPRPVPGLLEADEDAPAAGGAGSEPTVDAPATGSPEACRTVGQDPAPPLNVREEPRRGAAAVGTLDNGTEVRIAERRLPWLRLAAPVEGWIWAASTVEECGAP